MKAGFFPNLEKENIKPTLERAVSICHSYEIDVFMPDEVRSLFHDGWEGFSYIQFTSREEVLRSIDIAFSLGGDGTIIQLAKECITYEIPVCGINLGELGFLNQIELHNLQSRIHKISRGDYFIEKRSLLQGSIEGPSRKITLPLALNDYVITRKEPGKMARIILSIDGSETQQYPSDGLIVATATGSTGYNLSAGGPIMAPCNHSIIITPICPHLMQNASLVLSESTPLVITMPKREHALYVSIDGTYNVDLHNDESLFIQGHATYSQFIRFHDQQFFSTLFRKLNGRREVGDS